MAAKPTCPPNRPGIGSRTPWTDPSAGPAKSCKVFNTGFLGAKAPLQLQQCPRIILVHGPKHYILGLVASSKYPYNNIYIPLQSAFLRLEDSYSDVRDEIDGIYLNLGDNANISEAAQVVRAILDSSHHGADDFSIVVPAELLAEQKRTEHLFNTVMVAIASISLLVGGIGIMNIMLASILERTREIGLRRAVGARQSDIVRQFVVEATMISFAGGTIGVVFGFFISRLIAWLAGWSTIVTFSSIALAFLVSISVGLVFGIYPATKAARLDPVEAIRYE
jgi:putative ABC transport system permease protein